MTDVPSRLLLLVVAAVLLQRLLELRRAAANAAALRRRGAREHGAGHYPLFFLLHGGWLLAWPLEAWLRGPALAPAWPLWLALLVAAQLLRRAAIAALGQRWTTRVLVLPGAPPVARGPYRWLAHPNYLAVALELASAPLMFGARGTAAVVGVLNLLLLGLVRVPCEVAALRRAARERPANNS